MDERVWQLQDAKNKFSRLVKKAQENGPQIVTKHGREAVVILSFEDYQKIVSPQCDLVEFFRKSPLRETNIDFDALRTKDLPREVEI